MGIPSFEPHIPWYVPLTIYIVFGYVIVRWIGKHLADQPNQAKKLVLTFGPCAGVAILIGILSGQVIVNMATCVLWLAGVLNGIANIAHWKANRVSMSRTSLLSFGDDIVAIAIAIAILGDGQFINALGATGMGLCILAGVLFWWFSSGSGSSAFYKNVLIYSCLWGVCFAAQRYFAFDKVPIGQFLFAWYTATFVTVAVYYLYRHYRRPLRKSLYASTLPRPHEARWSLAFSLGIMVNLAIGYWMFAVAPLTVVQPILLVAEIFVPTFVGMIAFNEAHTFTRKEWRLMALAAIGTIIISLGFQGR